MKARFRCRRIHAQIRPLTAQAVLAERKKYVTMYPGKLCVGQYETFIAELTCQTGWCRWV